MRPSSAQYLAQAVALIPGGSLGRLEVPLEETMVINRGEGSRVWDVDGRTYIDFLMGSGPLILGHAHPEIVQTIQTQAALGTTFYQLSPQIVQLAEEMVQAIPCADQVKFTSTGSEAVQYAVRLARAFTGRKRILKFEGGYHGHSEYAVFSYAPKSLLPFPEAMHETLGVTEGVRKDVLVAPFNDLARTKAILNTHGSEVACIIVEPIQRTILPQPGFLQGLRDLADRYGTVLIFDEIVTGFRIAYGGAQTYYGVKPDLATYGKALAAGYPIAAVTGRADIMAHAGYAHPAGKFHFSGTFNGHALAASVALKALEIMRRPGTYDRLHQVGKIVKELIEGSLHRHSLPGRVLSGGPWFQLVLGEIPVTDYRSYQRCDLVGAQKINLAVWKAGCLVSPTSKSYLSLAHTDQDLSTLGEAFDKAIQLYAESQ